MGKGSKVLFYIVLLLLGVVLLVVSWRVPGFSDKYVKYVFPFFLESYGRLTGLFPFSVGEILIYIGVCYLALTVFIWILRFVMFISKKNLFKLVCRVNSKIFFKIVIWIFLIQVLNCFIMYHTTPMYANTAYDEYVSNTEDLFNLREMLVTEANDLAANLPRDERGALVYAGSMEETAKRAMKNIYDEAVSCTKKDVSHVDGTNSTKEDASYVDGTNISKEDAAFFALAPDLLNLKGYFPSPKPFLLSNFFSQQYMQGYYFPFSLEANYNNVMYISNIPGTMCHELSHLKGFIYEDEASFISYLACIKSGDLFFRYCGILDALSYVNMECQKELDLRPELVDVLTITPRSDLVKGDMIFLTKEAWEKVEETAVISTEIVSEASETFLETNLTINGVEDGMLAYSRLVDLLLKYYYGVNE